MEGKVIYKRKEKMGKQPQFAFIVHSRDVSDVSRKYKIAKVYSEMRAL